MKALRGYPNSMTHDIEMLAKSDLTRNQRSALQITLEEKKVLKKIWKWSVFVIDLLDMEDK